MNSTKAGDRGIQIGARQPSGAPRSQHAATACPTARSRRAHPPGKRNEPAPSRLHQPIQLALLHGAADVRMVLMPAAAQQDSIAVGAGGEVHHRRHARLRLQREEGHHRADRVRQHHPDMLARAGERRQLAAKHHAAQDQPAIGELGDASCRRFRSERYRRRPAAPVIAAAARPATRRTGCAAGARAGTRRWS